jgi:hypothetical protein
MPPTPIEINVPIYALDGVTTAMVLFLFAGLIVPSLIRNRQQFYVGFAAILLIVLIHTLQLMFRTGFMQVFGGVVIGAAQLVGLVTFFLCAGGMTIREVGKEFQGAYEVIRRGGEEKEVIIPLTGQRPAERIETPRERIDLTPPVERKDPPTPNVPSE